MKNTRNGHRKVSLQRLPGAEALRVAAGRVRRYGRHQVSTISIVTAILLPGARTHSSADARAGDVEQNHPAKVVDHEQLELHVLGKEISHPVAIAGTKRHTSLCGGHVTRKRAYGHHKASGHDHLVAYQLLIHINMLEIGAVEFYASMQLEHQRHDGNLHHVDVLEKQAHQRLDATAEASHHRRGTSQKPQPVTQQAQQHLLVDMEGGEVQVELHHGQHAKLEGGQARGVSEVSGQVIVISQHVCDCLQPRKASLVLDLGRQEQAHGQTNETYMSTAQTGMVVVGHDRVGHEMRVARQLVVEKVKSITIVERLGGGGDQIAETIADANVEPLLDAK